MPSGSVENSLRYMKRYGNPAFDLFALSDEHNELRQVLRDLCEKEIAPHSADVDESARFPEEALKVLNDTGFSAVHVSEEYGGQGADAVACCIVVEEVARVCASSSLIPGVNKLGTMGLILRGSEELKKKLDLGACWATWTVPFDHDEGFYFVATAYYMSPAVRTFWEKKLDAPILWYGATLEMLGDYLEKLEAKASSTNSPVSS